jgi:CheY-like chemotaxis protein
VSKQRASLRILLAEDDPVNQKLAMFLLAKEGNQVTLVDNGRQALDQMTEHSFDLVLMDIEMPEMGGIEATQTIRRTQTTTDAYLPIIALTAHAMKGDRERFLAAGMDDYLTKPIRPKELRRILDLHGSTPDVGATPKAEAPAPPKKDQALLSYEETLDYLDGDKELFAQMAELFITTYPRHAAAITQGIAATDKEAVQHAAHALKGAISPFAASTLSAATQRLEQGTFSQELDWPLIKNYWEELSTLLDEFNRQLRTNIP